MVTYVNLDVSIHGLQLKDDSELETFRLSIESIFRKLHPSLRFESDVVVEIVEHSGACGGDK